MIKVNQEQFKSIFIYTLALWCLIFSASTIFAGEDPNEKEYQSAIDTMSKTVVYLEFEQHDSEVRIISGKPVDCDLYYRVPVDPNNNKFIYEPKRKHIAGTGVIITSPPLAFIVTAKHLVKNEKSIGRFWVTTGETGIWTESFKDIQKSLKGAKWFFHAHADLAMHPISIPKKYGSVMGTKWQGLLHKDPELLTTVFIPGFPHTLGRDNIKLGPLVEITEIASWPAILPDSKPPTKVIFLNKRLANGYSGAPVFSLRNPPSYPIFKGHNVKLIGIQSGAFFSAKKQGIGVTQDELSYIVPAKYIIELLESEQVVNLKQLHKRIAAEKHIPSKQKENIKDVNSIPDSNDSSQGIDH